jgi:hypothetical protein
MSQNLPLHAFVLDFSFILNYSTINNGFSLAIKVKEPVSFLGNPVRFLRYFGLGV